MDDILNLKKDIEYAKLYLESTMGGEFSFVLQKVPPQFVSYLEHASTIFEKKALILIK